MRTSRSAKGMLNADTESVKARMQVAAVMTAQDGKKCIFGFCEGDVCRQCLVGTNLPESSINVCLKTEVEAPLGMASKYPRKVVLRDSRARVGHLATVLSKGRALDDGQSALKKKKKLSGKYPSSILQSL